MQQDSIFTKIIKGEIPCHKVYEDEHTIAFLDIHPIQPGHTLVVPKKQVETFMDLDDSDANSLWASARKVARSLSQAYPEKKRIALMIVGLDVDHAHIHLIPIDSEAEFRVPQDTSTEPDHAELAKIAEKLRT